MAVLLLLLPSHVNINIYDHPPLSLIFPSLLNNNKPSHSIPVLRLQRPSLSSTLPGQIFPSFICSSSKQFTGRTYSSVITATAADDPAMQNHEPSEKQMPTSCWTTKSIFKSNSGRALRNYREHNKQQDFWLVIEPKFLDNFPDIARRLNRPAVALVSTESRWIKFMKLRLDRVLRGEFEAATLTEALQSSSVHVSFEEPQTWTAPYPKYGTGWWTSFLLPERQ